MKNVRNAVTLAAILAAGVIGFGQMAYAQLEGSCAEQMKQVQAEMDATSVQADKDSAAAELAEAQKAAAANDEDNCKQHLAKAHEHVKH